MINQGVAVSTREYRVSKGVEPPDRPQLETIEQRALLERPLFCTEYL
jgi:hypothetical protein